MRVDRKVLASLPWFIPDTANDQQLKQFSNSVLETDYHVEQFVFPVGVVVAKGNEYLERHCTVYVYGFTN